MAMTAFRVHLRLFELVLPLPDRLRHERIHLVESLG
jgi:hypothetical protein